MNEIEATRTGEDASSVATPDAKPALVIDLDHTLVATDTLHEMMLVAARSPVELAKASLSLVRGRAHFKGQIARAVRLDPATLPYVPEVLDRVRKARSEGRTTVLATASHESVARAVQDHLRLFDHVVATKEDSNLKGSRKLAALENYLGTREFEYWGDATSDRPLWERSGAARVVASSDRDARRIAGGTEVAEFIRRVPASFRDYVKAMRVHQWLKNLLILVPLVTSHSFDDPLRVFQALSAFLCFSLCASSTYIINDLLDLPVDRRHPHKRDRPLASGRIRLLTGVGLASGLLATGLLLSFLTVGWLFGAMVIGYVAATLTYSLVLKKRALVDVFLLGGFYAFRVAAGAAAIGVVVSEWLISFSLFFFLSLAFAKRYTELSRALDREGPIGGRGYYKVDESMVQTMGVVSGYVSIVVLALYIQSPSAMDIYPNHQFLWLGAAAILYWVSRIWLLVGRGFMDEDPVLFAARDLRSIIAGLVVVESGMLAAWG